VLLFIILPYFLRRATSQNEPKRTKRSTETQNDQQQQKLINKEVHNYPKQVPPSKELRVKLISLSHCFFTVGAKDDLYDLFITKK